MFWFSYAEKMFYISQDAQCPAEEEEGLFESKKIDNCCTFGVYNLLWLFCEEAKRI